MSFQFEFDFTGKIAESYKKGYESGKTWNVNWMPGGPFVYKNDPVSKQEHEYYMQGFQAGLEENFAANPDYKKWFDNNRSGHVVYPHPIKS